MLFINPFTKSQAVLTNEALVDNNNIEFKKINGAYRILNTSENYTENFGFQWNHFVKTQIDNKINSFSKIRFFAETNWDKNSLENYNILEVGSGAGRFSEVILKYTNANLYSIDYSNAVEANFENNGHYGDRFKLFQASIYDMPFAPSQFDKVVCLGVLQHTPDFKKSVEILASMLKPGGELVIDFYPINGIHSKISAKYLLRPLTKKWSNEKLLKKIEKNVDWMIKTSHFLHKIKLGVLTRFLPLVDINGTLPHSNLTKEALREWCVLDTFDMFSPEYDNPQRISTVKKWLESFEGIQVTFADKIFYENSYAATIRAIKKNSI